MKKVIRIECKAGDQLLPIENLEEYQGDLVDLSDEAYEQLKKEIIEGGYSFAIHVWQHEGRNFILDGHQRRRTIQHMCEFEGWACPELPVVFVNAKSHKEAKGKLLAARSQYGDMTKQGLYEFAEASKFKFDELESRFKFNEINFKRFNEEFYIEPPEPSAPKETKEVKEVTFNAFECPKCGHKFYEGQKVKSESPSPITPSSTKIRRKGAKKADSRRVKGG